MITDNTINAGIKLPSMAMQKAPAKAGTASVLQIEGNASSAYTNLKVKTMLVTMTMAGDNTHEASKTIVLLCLALVSSSPTKASIRRSSLHAWPRKAAAVSASSSDSSFYNTVIMTNSTTSHARKDGIAGKNVNRETHSDRTRTNTKFKDLK